MFNGNFEVKTNKQQDICVSGRIDLGNVMNLKNNLFPLLDTVTNVKLDLSGIESADSSSLALLIECMRYAKMQRKEIAFYNMPKFMADLGLAYGLESVIPIN